MKVYLVGGAVRDHLLGYPVTERDWVVVGTTPQHMCSLGFKRVGKDFPVFLHPDTQEEYALARKERKSGPGYYGFVCEFNEEVSLEEDLSRRDLTINAIARDTDGKLIDPFGGLADLNKKILRHVSAAFAEDPVRVLRLARFAARYHHLGFKVAEETRQLMYKMVKKGELRHLIVERVWQEWQGSLGEKNPEVFVTTLRSCKALAVVLPELDCLFGVPNPPKHHPEIDSGIHSLMVLQEAVMLSTDPMVRFAALVHDLGKGTTPKESWPSHPQHEVRGFSIIEQLCHRLRIPSAWRKLAMKVSRLHLRIHRLKELSAQMIVKTIEETDAFRQPMLFKQLLIACEADAKGRMQQIEYWQGHYWQEAFRACLEVSVGALIEQGYEGIQIKKALYDERLKRINELRSIWKAHEK